MKFYVTVGLCANSDAVLTSTPEVAWYKIKYIARIAIPSGSAIFAFAGFFQSLQMQKYAHEK